MLLVKVKFPIDANVISFLLAGGGVIFLTYLLPIIRGGGRYDTFANTVVPRVNLRLTVKVIPELSFFYEYTYTFFYF